MSYYSPQDFIRLNNGEFMDFDGHYGAQCVDLFNYYKQQVVGGAWMGTPSTGGAADLWNDFAGDGNQYFDRIANTETNVPQYGDVMIWRANAKGVTGPAGHVGIFVSGNANSFNVFNQNWPNNSPCHVQAFPNYFGVIGWLRPKSFAVDRLRAAQAPVVTPPPVVAPIIPEPVVEPGMGAGQPNAEYIPIRTPEVANPAPDPIVIPDLQLQDLAEWEAGFKPFPNATLGPNDRIPGIEVHLKNDCMALDMTSAGDPKFLTADRPFRSAGTMPSGGKKYYRGTSGGWYGVSADNIQEEPEPQEPEPEKPNFWEELLGRIVRFIFRRKS